MFFFTNCAIYLFFNQMHDVKTAFRLWLIAMNVMVDIDDARKIGKFLFF